jgi:PAS domain S-box-containing protein
VNKKTAPLHHHDFSPVNTKILYWKNALILSIVYVLSGYFCIFELRVPPDYYSLIWIPSGVGLIMFLVLGNSAIIWVIISNFILNKFIYIENNFHELDYYNLFWGFMNAVIDTLQSYIAWKIAINLEKKQEHPLFTRNSQLISFFLLVCFLPAFLTSGILVVDRSLEIHKNLSFAKFLKLSIYFTVGNSIGILLVAPLYWAKKLMEEGKIFKNRFPIVITLTIITILLISFYQIPSILFLIIPFLVLLARKGNILHSIIVSFLICILLTIGTANRLGFFGTHIDSDTSFEMVLFLLTIMVVLYIATIAFSELKLNQEKLKLLVAQSNSTKEISEERYRMLAENVADVIWVWDLSLGKFTYISPSVFRLRGLTVEEAMKESIDSSLAPESAKKVLDKLANEIKNLRNYEGEKKYYYDELQQFKKDGTLIWIETVTQLVIKDNGQMEIFGVSRDIHQRKLAEEAQIENQNRLKELNATKDKFFSIIAHDLMNPFHTLIGFSSLLISQTAKKDLEGVVVSAKLMQDSAEKTRSLLKNLLEWSYTQTGKISFNPEHLELHLILQEVLGLLQPAADHKSIQLNIEIPEKGIIYADKHLFTAILRNLISNAIKYTYSGGRINIEAFKEDTEWIFTVKDNGLGMLPEVYKSIFEIGMHQSELGTEKEQGTGLGLILCKEFVELHQGKIWVESHIREGSTFSFSIPNK